MTRKDYVLLAKALRNTLLINCPTREYLEGAKAGFASAAERIADALAKDNPRFDQEHFLAVVRGERPLNSKPPRPHRHTKACRYLGNDMWNCGHIDNASPFPGEEGLDAQ